MDNLQTYHVERGRRNRSSIANAFQYLCDADKLISRERFRRFMRVWDGIENIDSSTLANKQKVNQSSVKANFMFSMCCIRRGFLMKDSAGFEDMLAFKNGRINEATLIEKLGAAMDSRISYSDFFELVSLMRCTFVVRFSASSDKLNKSMKQMSVAEIARHVVNMNNRSYIEETPISLHSSSYANSSELAGAVLESKNSKLEAAGVHPVPKAEDSEMDPENLEFFVSNAEETPAQKTLRIIHEHKISKCICSVLIVLQFLLCVIQMLSVNAYEQCARYKKEDAILKDPWMGCETFTWYNKNNAADVETAFNAANMVVSFFLFADVFVCICVKRRMFFFTLHHNIHFVNIIDAMLQLSIFIYDVVDLPMASGARPVARPVFVAFGVLRLLRVHRVLAYSTTIMDTIKLFRHLYPVVKAFFLIAYTFFFVWGILGMSLFSYSATQYGISLYPNKDQYVDYYKSRAPSDYPNGNNPGNFGCNETDILGNPGFCGEYGPSSPEPHWDTTPDTPEQRAALDAAFVIGSGWDARVGGCFNLVGEANNRVLPCYCYYNAGLMNRTTSCDWINPGWYNTPLGQSNYWILNFNDFKVALVHLFGIMIVNNWNTFYFAYQAVFGREIFLYFLTFYFFIVVVTYSLLVSFVMEAFFLHYNSKKAPSEDSPEDESGLALSEKLRIGRQLAFAVVCLVEHAKENHGVLQKYQVVYGGKKMTVDDSMADMFSSQSLEDTAPDADPVSDFSDFQVISPSEEEFKQYSKSVIF